MTTSFIFGLAVLIISVVLHEVAHGYVAESLGDPTARLAGRLTLNPIKHLDPFGSVILPLLLSLSGTGVVFGWAKPVPYNPYNLRAGRWGPALVALAGPASNLALVVVFALLFRLLPLAPAMAELIALIVLVNLSLAFFNLVPIPPLDGSKILFAILPLRWRGLENWLNHYSLVLLLFFLLFLWDVLAPLVFRLFLWLIT